jgi:hypothetical protein
VLPTRVPTARELAGYATAPLVLAVEGESTASATPDAPEEVVPQRVPERVAPVTKTKSTRRLQPGDLICGQCGQGNPPTRKFCNRCGEELANAEAVQAKWYSRLKFWRRRTTTVEAGARPGQKGAPRDKKAATYKAYRRVRAIAVTILLVMAMLYVIVPGLRENVNRVVSPPVGTVRDWASGKWRSLTNSTETMPPFSVKASSALRGHPGSAAFDNVTNTYWAAAWTPKDKPFLRISYKEPQTLTALVVHPGAQDGEDAAKFLRPAELVIRYGSGATDTVQLPPDGDVITVKIDNASTFRAARITVTKVHPQEGLKNVAISEIELKRKKQ